MFLAGPDRPDLLREETLADLLEATAARQPDAIALRMGQQCLSYGELDAAADRVAHRLIQYGALPGRLVGLWAPRGLEALVLQAGIAKSGAGFMPFDADAPLERIAACLDDGDAIGLLVGAACVEAARTAIPRPVWACAVDPRPVSPAEALQRRRGLDGSHVAYVLYTSGTTGKPKGIAVSHRAICHFLRAENAVLGVRQDDLVQQGFSLAFDMSFEEIWIAYLVGASLWVAPKALIADPDALVEALAREHVTVLHAVPTLVGLFPRDVPSIRLLNLGGEPCPQSLVDRFATPGRLVFNTYGPTEATVSATVARLQPGDPVALGVPLPNYGVWLRGERGEILPVGAAGELCITGPGVAEGYLGRPTLTAEKFIAFDAAPSPQHLRAYRTGDLARIDATGRVHGLGRADDQLKLRGFRVEPGEIESALAACAGVAAAAVVLREVADLPQLVAFMVPMAGAGPASRPDAAALRAALTARLPPYMVPAVFSWLDVLPRLASGKLDRQALRVVPLGAVPSDIDADAAVTDPALAAVLAAARPLFPGHKLNGADDFFDSLGGHSLLAARFVSRLRSAGPQWAGASVQDVYRERTLAGIASRLGAAQPRNGTVPEPPHTAPLPPRWRRRLCGIAQAAVVPPLVALRMAVWLAPFFTYHYFTGDETDSIPAALAASLVVYVLANAATFAFAITGKWAVAGRLRAGRVPLWSVAFFRFWLAERLMELPPRYLLSSSPLHATYLRLLGARIGREVSLASISLRAPDLLRVDDGASIGSSTQLENARVLGGELVLGSIHIGRDATVGSYCALEGDTVVEADARLDGLSALASGQRVPTGEHWMGTPARFHARVDPTRVPPRPVVTPLRHRLESVLHAVGAALVLVLFFLPVFPAFMLVDLLDPQPWMQGRLGWLAAVNDFTVYVLLGMPAAAVLIGATVGLSAALRWWALPRLAPGWISLHSGAWHRKWLTNQIQEASLAVLHGLYATVYSPWWYRALGARVGHGVEISTALGVVPDMLTLGDESFIADAVMLGDEEVDRGWVRVQPIVVGSRSFIGNGAFVPDGTCIPEQVLLGVQSRAPANGAMHPGDTWLGSPALRLPAREPAGAFPDFLTFSPGPGRRLARAIIEALRIVLPLALVVASGYLIVREVMPVAERGEWLSVLRDLALAGIAYGAGCWGTVVALKWVLIGRYRPRAVPMWTPFVWLSEAVTNVYESIAVPNFVGILRGTPWLPWALRALGTHIGRDVYLDTTDFTEFDCVRIGDGAVLNAWCGPQTHLFEDRVMKIGPVEIGAGAQIGTRCTVLFGARVGDGVYLAPLTLVGKGEELPAGTGWCGVPAQPLAGGTLQAMGGPAPQPDAELKASAGAETT
jgi:non-ribosomal peptide synthetase-like protein